MFNRVPPRSPGHLQQQGPQADQTPARQGGQSRRPAHAAPDELRRSTGPEGRSPESPGTPSRARRAVLPAASASPARADPPPTPRRAPQGFPQQQLNELVAECCMLPAGLLSAPPPSIEALSARERSQLETALMQRFTDGPHNMHAITAEGEVANLRPVPPSARAAMQAWLMVQSARLRHIDPAIMESARNPEFLFAHLHTMGRAPGLHRPVDRAEIEQSARAHLRASLSNSHLALHRPEYANALNNFLMLLDPSRRLHPVLHSQVVAAFNNHRLEERISPQVAARVNAHGIEALAEQRYELNGSTGKFRSQDERWGRHRPPRTPDHAMVPRPSGEGSSSAASQAVPVQRRPELNLTDRQAVWLNQTLGLSRAPRERTGKLPDSEQYQRIKSMPPEDRHALEANLEFLFLRPAGSGVLPATAQSALEAWLTTQQVRLRVHSEASLKQHAKVLHSFGNAAKVMKAKLGGSRGQSEFSRFHSEHESTKRPEYATALNNFMRVLHPGSPLSPELKDQVAARLMYHADTEGTISDQVLGELQHYGPLRLAEDGWHLDPRSNDFSPPLPPAVAVINPFDPLDRDRPQHFGTPTIHRHAPLTPPRK
jgi:hypothetical protein